MLERIVFQSLRLKDNFIFLVAMRLGETPVHIPNTMVKTQAADGTRLETARKNRWPPDIYFYEREDDLFVIRVLRELSTGMTDKFSQPERSGRVP